MPNRLALAIAALLLAASGPAAAQKLSFPFEGFLCCNLLNDGGWVNDINYRGSRKQLLPAGTPVKATGLGRSRVQLLVDGKKIAIGNDYSRAIGMDDFARRYILTADPRPVIEGFPPKVREAIAEMKLMRGMTREQVLMSVGYPPAYYTPDLEAPLWRYWADSGSEFQVFWGNDGKVDQVFGPPAVRERVVLE
jgi:hypothetical protein